MFIVDHEPTQDELDAMIAEQLANLPSWWQSECERQELMARNELIAIRRSNGWRITSGGRTSWKMGGRSGHDNEGERDTVGLKLYDLSSSFAALADTMTSDEVPPDVEAGIDALQLAVEAKVGGCVKVWQQLAAEEEAYRAESQRLAKMAAARKNAVERLKAYVSRSLDAAGIPRVVTDVGKVSICNASRPSIRWNGAGDPPPAFSRVKVELDGNLAYAVVKAGGTLPDGFTVETSRVVRVT